MKAVETPKQKPRRRRSGCAEWHMSRKAVSIDIEQVSQMEDRQCLDFLVQARFGGWSTVQCPHCRSIGRHYWRRTERRWKCKACDKTFSITSGTVFSNRKMRPQRIVLAALLWVNGAGGKPALELKRDLNTTYNTQFTLISKLREGLVRGYNVGRLNGDIEMDGAHQSGWRAAEKRGKPQITQPVTNETPVEQLEAVLTTAGQQNERHARKQQPRQLKPGERVDPEYGNVLAASRRIFYAVRERSGIPGRGAVRTRVAVGLMEDHPTIKAVVRGYVAAPESALNTDSHGAYKKVGEKFREHRTVEHSKQMVGPNGENSNQAEELNARFDRAEKGIYLNIEPKYMLDYASETAFRSDTRRTPNGHQLKLAMHIAMSVGQSMWWTGFTHGRHRKTELLIQGPQAAPSSGPPKKRSPISQVNGRPPR